MRPALLLVPLALVAAAGPRGDRPLDPADQAKLDKKLAGYVAGTPTSCLPYGYPSASTTAYGRLLVYQQANGPIFVNDTGGGCEAAARGDVLVSIEYEGRPCSGDIIRTVDPFDHFPTGSCALHDFVPYTKPKTR